MAQLSTLNLTYNPIMHQKELGWYFVRLIEQLFGKDTLSFDAYFHLAQTPRLVRGKTISNYFLIDFSIITTNSPLIASNTDFNITNPYFYSTLLSRTTIQPDNRYQTKAKIYVDCEEFPEMILNHGIGIQDLCNFNIYVNPMTKYRTYTPQYGKIDDHYHS